MEPWHFAYVADIHVGTPRSYRFCEDWNRNWQTAREQIVDAAPEFLIVGGDLTRDGATHRFELERIQTDFDDMPFPVHAIPGNHETGNKVCNVPTSRPPDPSVAVQQAYLDLYASVFGASEWSFVHKDVRFSGFDGFLAGSSLAREQAFWDWMEAQVHAPRARHHVWFLHAALFADELHESNRDPAQDRTAWYFTVDEPHRSRMVRLFKDTGAELVVTGHIHCRRTVRAEGLTFAFAPATAFAQWGDRWPDGDPTLGWLDCTVDEGGVHPQFVPLREAHTGGLRYGPGGNPPLEGRDYGAAAEHPPLDPDEERFPSGKAQAR